MRTLRRDDDGARGNRCIYRRVVVYRGRLEGALARRRENREGDHTQPQDVLDGEVIPHRRVPVTRALTGRLLRYLRQGRGDQDRAV